MSLRSSGNGGGAKVGRKVRVALGKSEGSGDGARSSGLKNGNIGRTRTRVVLSTRESKRLSDDVRTLDSKKKGGRRVKNRADRVGADAGERLGGKGESTGRRGLKIKNKNERFEAGGDGKSKQVRKNAFENGTVRKMERVKDSLVTRNVSAYNAVSVRNAQKRRDQDIHLGCDGKLKNVRKSAFGDGTLGKMERVEDSSITRKGIEYNDAVSVGKARKKRDQEKDNSAINADLMANPLKKKKRTLRISIRIDPYDMSNKRLDDDASDNGNNQTKNNSEEDGVELSKNAQFRAICPSPSILSFVEDNLLGRRRQIEFKRAGYNTEFSCPLDNIPFSTNPEREQIEIPIFKNNLEFFAAAKISSSFPPPTHPEIAFAGRSNVGKSSLLNSLTRQWGVVRTSDKPGLTQTINFFKLGPKINLVDLPGYGFAYAKDEVKEAWEELVKEYVSTRSSLKRVCLLIDTKWGFKPRDYELIDLMERSQTKYQIVLTKTDLVFPIDVARRAMQIEENLKAKKSAVQPLMMVSSKTGAGIRSLRTALSHIARFVKR